METQKQYSVEFIQDTVNYYLSFGKSLKQVAGKLKVCKSTLSKWAASAKKFKVYTPNLRTNCIKKRL